MPAGLVLRGKIKAIFNAEIVGQSFEKRLFHLVEPDTVQYPQTWAIECHQGHVNILDKFSPGDTVDCSVEIRGKVYVKDGREMCFNTLKCWQIKLVEQSKQYPQQQPSSQSRPGVFNSELDTSDDLPF